jgi:steroid 5-alpha reductase family enzyme
MLEKVMLDAQPEKYRAYMKSTSAFVPWFPKKKRASGRAERG